MNKKLTGVSLFSGAGGMDVGFERAGVDILVANEIVKDAADTYMLNHPKSKMINDDINNSLEDLEEYKDVDIVFGGPPCQGFSVAGKMDPDDERSKLIFTFLDVVGKLTPRAFVMENVKALATLDKWSEVRKRYLERVSEMGYNCRFFVLNAADYGVSQKRERVFFVGIRNDDNLFLSNELENLLIFQKNKAPTIKELLLPLGKAGNKNNPKTCTAKITFATKPIMRKSAFAGMYFNGQGRPINIDGYANTLPASMGGNKTPFIDEDYLYGDAMENWVIGYHKGLLDGTITPVFEEAPSRLRRLTIKEAGLIQSFPEEYVFCGTNSKVYTQIGNAVPCKLAEAVAKVVVQYLNNKKI